MWLHTSTNLVVDKGSKKRKGIGVKQVSETPRPSWPKCWTDGEPDRKPKVTLILGPKSQSPNSMSFQELHHSGIRADNVLGFLHFPSQHGEYS